MERLNSNFMAEGDPSARQDIQRELNALQIAVDHYRAALAIEERLHEAK